MVNGAGEDRFYSSADGLRLHLRDYRPDASGPPVVCLAGLTRSADDFDALARALAFDATAPRRVIALDYRGRGQSASDPDWRNYNLAVERADILAGLRACGVENAHFIGTSRGGLHIMALAGEHRGMLRSAVLNDIGPVLEPAGLERIKGYVGQQAAPRDLGEAVTLLKATAGAHFTGLDEEGWRGFAVTTFGADPNHLRWRYDPALRHSLDDLDLTKPLPDLWRQFDRLAGLPVMTLRGSNSDLLSPTTFDAMRRRWPGCEGVEVAGQGHAPLLADPATIDAIAAFLARADGTGGNP